MAPFHNTTSPSLADRPDLLHKIGMNVAHGFRFDSGRRPFADSTFEDLVRSLSDEEMARRYESELEGVLSHLGEDVRIEKDNVMSSLSATEYAGRRGKFVHFPEYHFFQGDSKLVTIRTHVVAMPRGFHGGIQATVKPSYELEGINESLLAFHTVTQTIYQAIAAVFPERDERHILFKVDPHRYLLVPFAVYALAIADPDLKSLSDKVEFAADKDISEIVRSDLSKPYDRYFDAVATLFGSEKVKEFLQYTVRYDGADGYVGQAFALGKFYKDPRGLRQLIFLSYGEANPHDTSANVCRAGGDFLRKDLANLDF